MKYITSCQIYLTLWTRTTRSPFRGAPKPDGSGRDDPGLDGLVLGVGDQAGVQHLFGFLQPPDRLRLWGSRAADSSRGHLKSSGAGPQFFQLANPALLAPGLILRLADAVNRRACSLRSP